MVSRNRLACQQLPFPPLSLATQQQAGTCRADNFPAGDRLQMCSERWKASLHMFGPQAPCKFQSSPLQGNCLLFNHKPPQTSAHTLAGQWFLAHWEFQHSLELLGRKRNQDKRGKEEASGRALGDGRSSLVSPCPPSHH